MKIDNFEAKRIAQLSRLKFDDAELKSMEKHLETVLGYFDMLDSVDTSSVLPTAHILDSVNVLREDFAKLVPFSREQLLKNAPESENGCYIVPRVVE